MNEDPELAEHQLIEQIRRSPHRKPRMTRDAQRPTLERARFKSPSRRCSCGTCAGCIDNARWERIFQEKFADPNYYRQPLEGRRSSPWE